MASIYDNIRAALETQLSNISGIPDISWENVSFEPTTGSSFVKSNFIPSRRYPAHRGLNPQMYYQGMYRVDCYCPEGKGPKEADDLANLVIESFEATSDIAYDTDTVIHIRYAERGQSFVEGAWNVTPVMIGWYIYE